MSTTVGSESAATGTKPSARKVAEAVWLEDEGSRNENHCRRLAGIEANSRGNAYAVQSGMCRHHSDARCVTGLIAVSWRQITQRFSGQGSTEEDMESEGGRRGIHYHALPRRGAGDRPAHAPSRELALAFVHAPCGLRAIPRAAG